MPTLEHDQLVFRFPQIEAEARFSIDFQRTLRIPDTVRTYDLPPGLGAFPLRHADDHADRLPGQAAARGGVILPIWQAEAMWLNFTNQGPGFDLDFPVAVKVAAGKINAVTGEAWRPGLHRVPQDYMVSPEQPWLDGFAVERGVVRQFVTMELGEGYSAEEQLTGQARWGGLHIVVVPLKARVWQERRRAWEEAQDALCFRRQKAPSPCMLPSATMGLAPGGRMRQAIHPDPFDLDDWDMAQADRVFVTLLHAKDWKSVTGEAAPNHPPTAEDYAQAGLPWFAFYGKDQAALPGGKPLKRVKSLAKLFKEMTGATLPGSQDVETGAPVKLGPAAQGHRPVRTQSSWDC